LLPKTALHAKGASADRCHSQIPSSAKRGISRLALARRHSGIHQEKGKIKVERRKTSFGWRRVERGGMKS